MSLAAARRASNIRRSVQTAIGNAITTATGAVYPVYHSSPWSDPGGVRQDASDVEQTGWVETQWVDGLAGRRGASILQADIYRRILSEGQALADPFGIEADAMLDALTDVFSGLGTGGVLKACVRVKDFAIPAAPVNTDTYALCIATRGQYGEPESVTRQPLQGGGIRRITARWRFILTSDAGDGAGFYTS